MTDVVSIIDHGGWEAPIPASVPVPEPAVRRRPLFREIYSALSAVSEADHDRAVTLAIEAKEARNRFFFIGNGGSAAIASHMAADWLKTSGVAAMCFNDAALMSCLANDVGYEEAFSRPLRLHGVKGDLLFAISSSGRSKSIINAVEVAYGLGMKTITLSGFLPDNRLRAMGDVNFYVSANRYGTIEVAHHAICHSILDAVMASS